MRILSNYEPPSVINFKSINAPFIPDISLELESIFVSMTINLFDLFGSHEFAKRFNGYFAVMAHKVLSFDNTLTRQVAKLQSDDPQ